LKIPFRIYRSHDYDLMVLFKTKCLDVVGAAAGAMVAEANKDSKYRISVDFPDSQKIYVPSSVYMIAEINDEETIKLYKSITPGVRCSWIKNLIRKYMDNENLHVYMNRGIVVENETEDTKIKIQRPRGKHVSSSADSNPGLSLEKKSKKKQTRQLPAAESNTGKQISNESAPKTPAPVKLEKQKAVIPVNDNDEIAQNGSAEEELDIYGVVGV